MKVARPYFSWSQYYLWNTSKKEFYKRYGLDEKSQSNKYFEKGKELGLFKETGEIPHYVKNPEMLETVSTLIDELEVMEHEVQVTIGDYTLLSFMDSGMEDYSEFLEYKTGKEPWTQNRVDLWEQLDFYALCYYIASGEKTIPKCRLFWAETIEDEETGELQFTGLVEEFERKFTKDDMVLMLSKIITAKIDIEEWQYMDFTLEEAKVNRYVELLKRIKNDTEEVELMKLEIITLMEQQNVEYASASKGSFSISKRKNWVYTEELNDKEKKYKDEIKHEKKLQQKRREAKIIVSESLRFTIEKNKNDKQN